MIIQNPDNSLSYTDPTGKVVKVSIFDSTTYAKIAAILVKQQQAQGNNKTKLDLYTLNLQSSQDQINRGVDVPAPTKPLMEVVDDQGVDSFVPFVPPLADLKLSTIPVAPSTGSGAATTNLPPDYAQLTYLMVEALFKKDFPQG